MSLPLPPARDAKGINPAVGVHGRVGAGGGNAGNILTQASHLTAWGLAQLLLLLLIVLFPSHPLWF